MMAGVSSIFLILICLGAGVWLRRTDRLKDSAPAALNSVVLQVCLPALILTQIHSLPAGL